MAEGKIATNNANKLAMSRALGTAFLNHQVEQLEKTMYNSAGSGNWRDRRSTAPGNTNASKLRTSSPVPKLAQRKKAGEPQVMIKEKPLFKNKEFDRNVTNKDRRRSAEGGKAEKDADVVVVDASVLIHALYKIKKWCREGREEVVIVPLEALNTLDLLKKGTSSLAQRARAASRILEAQVGTNPRIRVQRDDAFVLWDNIKFKDSSEWESKLGPLASTSPEWVRRTICCARWEVENPETETNSKAERPNKSVDAGSHVLNVVLAVLSSSPTTSPQSAPMKLTEGSNDAPMTPVPLPAPTLLHTNKFEPRSSGTLVAHWAAKAEITLLEVDPTLPGRGAEDDDRPRRAHPHSNSHGPRGRRSSGNEGMNKVGLVERPPAVMAMMEMVAQPSKVVRVLARGEKLDPDP